jgi:heme/copper-type cytochrome/quinol oxidase subunit 2
MRRAGFRKICKHPFNITRGSFLICGRGIAFIGNLSDKRPTSTVANELHIPVGRPVVISLRAGDVIHTFWAPSLHGKTGMIPGRDALISLRADQAGIYRGQCAEFCGAERTPPGNSMEGPRSQSVVSP